MSLRVYMKGMVPFPFCLFVFLFVFSDVILVTCGECTGQLEKSSLCDLPIISVFFPVLTRAKICD